MIHPKLKRTALRITIMYAVVAAIWILLSDRALVALVSDPATLGRLSTYKGWAFVVVTGSLLYGTLHGQLRRWQHAISARVEAEKSLQESDERYRVAIERSRDGVALLRGDKLIFVNRSFLQMFGYGTVEEVLGKPVFLTIHPDDREMVARQVVRGEQDGPALPVYEFRGITKEGATKWIEASVAGVTYLGEPAGLAYLRDVTERKIAEKALQKSETKFRSYIEWSPLAVFVANREGLIADSNRAASELLGYDVKALSRMHVWELHHPDDRDMALQDFASLVRKGYFKGEYRFLRQDGSFIWVSIHASMVGDQFSLAYCWDITDHKQSEETLRRYELLSHHSRDIILFMEKDTGRILEANTAAGKAYGYTREEIRGLTIKDLRTPDALGSMTSEVLEADSRGILFETIHCRKDGSTFPVEVSSRGATINGARTLISIVRDITERKEREKEIEILKHSIDIHYDAAYWMNGDNEFVYANEAACKVLGYDRRELIGMTVHEVNPRATPERMNDAWKQLRAGGSFLTQSAHRRKDGGEFPVEIITTYVQFDGKEYACGFARDITEKQRLEEQLRQAQKMEAVGTLAGGVAHDFNNILSVILGYAELAIATIDEGSPVRTYLVEIQKAAGRSADITRQLLAFARKQTIAPKILDLNETVEGMLKMLRRLIGENIDLVWLPKAGLWPAKIDPSQLDQIFANLCVNAKDAIANTGRISIETANVVFDEAYCVHHTAFTPGQFVMIAVSDDGSGMDQETLTKIFEPFFTTKEVGKGTGLGLATVYGIVRQNEGFINVYSEPGKGTTFKIYLPRQRGKISYDEEKDAARIDPSRGETVLVVEDDPAILNLAERFLAGLGYNVLIAEIPWKALEIAANYAGNIDLLMTDVVMPAMNGKELAQELRKTRPATKCLFMSGYTADAVAHSGVLEEGIHFVQKPFSLVSLAAKVRAAIDFDDERA